jgi:DNA-binding transcriptional regulator YhcF (GntR family)
MSELLPLQWTEPERFVLVCPDSGEELPGASVASIAELAAAAGTSEHEVCRVLDELEARGLIRRPERRKL